MSENRDEAGRFLPGNKFWEVRSSAGPKPKFKDGEALWASCVEYFEWSEDNPLYEDKLVSFQGITKHEPVAKMRAMTVAGLCVFLDIARSTWNAWRSERSDLSEVITRAESIIRTQKFEGASADLLNANIIARDLGMADTTRLAGHDGGALEVEEVKLTPKEFARRFAFVMASAAEEQRKEQEQAKNG